MSKNLPDMAESYEKKHPEEGGMKSEDLELPEVTPEPGKEGRFTNQLKYIRYNILDAFSRIPEAKFFKRPVDPVKDGLPHYFDFIKRPMDLSTIRRRILNKYYWSGKECLADLGLMFVNAYVYNQPDSGLVKCAKKLELTLLEKLLEYPKLEEEIESLAAVRVTSDRALTPLTDESPGVVLRSRRGSSMASSLDPDSQSIASTMKRSGYESDSESSVGGSESSDSESSGSEGEVIYRKTPAGLKKSILPLIQQQMNLIRQQMAVLAEIVDEQDSGPRKTRKGKRSKTTKKKAASLASENSKSRSVSPKTPNKGKFGKGRPPQKRTKLDFSTSPVDSARKKVKGLRNTDSMPYYAESPPMKKTPKQEKINKVENETKYDTSRPMTEEEIDNLIADINKVSHEDMLQVIQKARVASYLPDDNAEEDDDDSFPVEKFPRDKQWHVRTLIDEILENSARKASDQPSTSESAKVTDPPSVGTNSDGINGEGNSQSNALSQEEVKEQDESQDMLDLDYGEDEDSLNVY